MNDSRLPVYRVTVKPFPGETAQPGDTTDYGKNSLIAYLKANIEHEAYSGDGDQLESIHRIDPGGVLVPMDLPTADGRPTRDHDESADRVWLNSTFRIYEAGGDRSNAEVIFTVSIDGDA